MPRAMPSNASGLWQRHPAPLSHSQSIETERYARAGIREHGLSASCGRTLSLLIHCASADGEDRNDATAQRRNELWGSEGAASRLFPTSTSAIWNGWIEQESRREGGMRIRASFPSPFHLLLSLSPCES